jgi:uncharacterized delta-60 repeat protein
MLRRIVQSLKSAGKNRRRGAGRKLSLHNSAFESLETRALLSAGNLDVSFGNGGQVTTEFEESSSWGRVALATALQSDGKIVAVGEGAIARYLPDGSLDVTFGTGGKAAFPHYARAVALQNDGGIVIVGGTESINSADFVVTRFLSNGTLDTSFSGDGIVLTDFGANETAYDVAVQGNGRIVVVGGSGNEIAIARYTTSGELDSSFDGDGKFQRLFNTNRTDTAYAVGLQTDGRIVVAGKTWVSYTFNSSNHDFFVMRMNSNGSLDSTFGGSGYINTNFGKVDDARDLLIQPDGRIVVSGSAEISSQEYLAIARYNSDGSLDTSFDGDGRLQFRTPGALTDNSTGVAVALQANGSLLSVTSSYVYRFTSSGQLDSTFNTTGRSPYIATTRSVLVQPDGAIVAGGFHLVGFAVARFTATGAFDNSFSSDGLVTTLFGPSVDEATSSAVQSDGKIVVAGRSQGRMSVARYLANGSLDLTFSGDGRTTIDFGAEYLESGANDVVIQPDGKILLVGAASLFVNQLPAGQMALVRLNSDGSLDTSFSSDGLVTTTLGDYAEARTVALQADGRIVVGGFAGSQDFMVARYLANGQLDTSFRGTGFAIHFNVSNFVSSVTKVLILPDQRILAVGNTSLSGRSTINMVRYNPNGSLDTTFGVNARVADTFNPLRSPNDAELLPDGSLLVIGNAEAFASTGRTSSMAISKYDSAGAPTGFGTVVRSVSQPYPASPLQNYVPVADAESLLVQPNGKILIGGTSEGRFALWRIHADGTNDTSFGGDGYVTTEFVGSTGRLADLQQQSNGRIVAIGTLIAPVTQKSSDRDFLLTRYLEGVTPTNSTSVSVNSSGQIEVRDLWGRDENWTVFREGETLVLQDNTGDSQVKISVSGIVGVVGAGTNRIAIPVSEIDATGKPLLINSLSGNDGVFFSSEADSAPSQGVTFRGGAGEDTFSQAGSAISASWRITSGTGFVVSPGRQSRGFSGVERFFGGMAQDNFVIQAATSAVTTVLHGGAGAVTDTLTVSGNADMRLTNSEVRLTGAINQRLAIAGFESGGLSGGENNNVLNAADFSGPVKLQGFGGNDVLTGGRFADQMYAGDGDDLLFGGHGNDLLDGGRGNDVLNGDYDDDVLYGFDGHDILIGGFGADSLYGGNGEDLLIGGLSSFFYVNSVPSEQAAIQAAWASSESYASKVLKLGTTGIPVGNVTLKLATSNSVFNDLSIDLYFGRADLDWFFASQSLNFNEIGLASGGVRDLALGETLTPVL